MALLIILNISIVDTFKKKRFIVKRSVQLSSTVGLFINEYCVFFNVLYIVRKHM